MADNRLTKDQERLAKLWDAYEIQEKELEFAMKKIATIESKISESERINGVLKKAVEDRDKEIRNFELKIISLEEEKSKYQPQLDELNRLFTEEKERYAKLFTITEELEEDLAKTKKEVEVKDAWFEKNVGMLENLRESIVERKLKLGELEKTEAITHISEKREEKAVEEKQPETESGPSRTPNIIEKTSQTEDTKKKEESITFKTVAVEKESKPEVPSPEPVNEFTSLKTPVNTSFSKTDEISKNETIYEYTKIPDVDPIVAETLYSAGYTDMTKLRNATTEDLAKIDGITPTLARKIRTNLFDIGS